MFHPATAIDITKVTPRASSPSPRSLRRSSTSLPSLTPEPVRRNVAKDLKSPKSTPIVSIQPASPAQEKRAWWAGFKKDKKDPKHKSWDNSLGEIKEINADDPRKVARSLFDRAESPKPEADKEKKEREERERREKEEKERKEKEEKEKRDKAALQQGKGLSTARRGHRKSKSWWWGDNEQTEEEKEEETLKLRAQMQKNARKNIQPEHLAYPWQTTEKEVAAIAGFLKELRAFQDSLITEIENHVLALIIQEEEIKLPTFFEDEDNIQKLIFCFPKAEREFYEDFLMTQHFTVFTEKFVESIDGKQKDAVLKKIKELENSLEEEEKQKASAISVLKIYQEGSAMVAIPVQLREELEETVKLSCEKIEAIKTSLRKLTRFNTLL